MHIGMQYEDLLNVKAIDIHINNLYCKISEKDNAAKLHFKNDKMYKALKNNLYEYKKLLQSHTKIMVMVKASAYGAGLAEVAQLMESEKVDYLTVAYIDEGVLLREAGIKIPILVLNPEPAGFDALFRYQLEKLIFSSPTPL